MAQSGKTLKDYLDGLRRRRGQCLGVAFAIVGISGAVALGWPPTYRSTATILIEQQQIPEDLVRSTVTSYADQRIQEISQRVMTRANLLGIIQKYGLYPKAMKSQPSEVVIDRMRDDIDLSMVSADVIDPRIGRPIKATIAFKLSYENRSPDLAQKVANELTSLYLNENLKRRTELATETSDFMTDEANRLSHKITKLEAALADFKKRNADTLPDLRDLNLQLRDRAESSLMDVDSRMRDLQQRIASLKLELDQLSATDSFTDRPGEQNMNPAARLKVLQTKLVGMEAVYAPDYPTLVRLRKEVAALKQKVGKSSGDTDGMKKRIQTLETQLRTDQGTYSSDYPEVKRLEKSIAKLRAALKQAQTETVPADASSDAADNPGYIDLKSQLDAATAELSSLKTKRRELRAKLDAYDAYLAKTPEVEREYRALTRDYKNAVAHYQVIKAKQLEAQMAKSLETERKGERFTLIDPPQVPEQPVKPNRLAIGVLGLVFSIGGGVGTGMMLENMDLRVRGMQGVTRLGIPLLASVPYIETRRERIRRRRVRLVSALAVMAFVIVALVLVHLLYMPLDVLWFSLQRRLGMSA